MCCKCNHKHGEPSLCTRTLSEKGKTRRIRRARSFLKTAFSNGSTYEKLAFGPGDYFVVFPGDLKK